MRRLASILLFILGGWMLMCEPVVAFIRADQTAPEPLAVQMMILGLLLVLGAIPLAIGTLISPGERLKELGLTILLSVGAGVFSLLALVAMVTDPGAKPFLPPMPKFDIAPIVGTLNLLLITVLGAVLYRMHDRRGVNEQRR